MSQSTSPAVVSSALSPSTASSHGFSHADPGPIYFQEGPDYTITHWIYLPSQKNTVPVLKINKAPPRQSPTSHLKILRNPKHEQQHCESMLGTGFSNGSEAYIRLLEKQYDTSHRLLTQPASSSWLIEHKSNSEVAEILRWGRHLEQFAPTCIMHGAKCQERKRIKKIEEAMVEAYKSQNFDLNPEIIALPCYDSWNSNRLATIKKDFRCWSAEMPYFQAAGYARKQMMIAYRETDEQAIPCLVAWWKEEKDNKDAVNTAREKEDVEENSLKALFRESYQRKEREKQAKEDQQRLEAEQAALDIQAAIQEQLWDAMSSPLGEAVMAEEIIIEGISITAGNQDILSQSSTDHEQLRHAMDSSFDEEQITPTTTLPRTPSTRGNSYYTNAADILADGPEDDSDIRNENDLFYSNISTAGNDAPPRSLIDNNAQANDMFMFEEGLSGLSRPKVSSHRLGQTECSSTDSSDVTSVRITTSFTTRVLGGTSIYTADNIHEFFNDTTYDSESSSNSDDGWNNPGKTEADISTQATNNTYVTKVLDSANLLRSGWPPENLFHQLSACTWLPFPLFYGSHVLHQAAKTRRVPQIMLTMPSGIECELREHLPERDEECVEWLQYLNERGTAQGEMRRRLEDWRGEEESWAEYERRDRAEKWWASRHAVDRVAEARARRRDKIQRGEMKVVRAPTLEVLDEEEREETNIRSVTWKVERERRIRRESFRRKDSGYHTAEEDEEECEEL